MAMTKWGVEIEFGIWTLPATMGAARLAAESRFEAAHYDAVEREVRRAQAKEITRHDVQNVLDAIQGHEAAICGQCGLFVEFLDWHQDALRGPVMQPCDYCGAPTLDDSAMPVCDACASKIKRHEYGTCDACGHAKDARGFCTAPLSAAD